MSLSFKIFWTSDLKDKWMWVSTRGWCATWTAACVTTWAEQGSLPLTVISCGTVEILLSSSVQISEYLGKNLKMRLWILPHIDLTFWPQILCCAFDCAVDHPVQGRCILGRPRSDLNKVTSIPNKTTTSPHQSNQPYGLAFQRLWSTIALVFALKACPHFLQPYSMRPWMQLPCNNTISKWVSKWEAGRVGSAGRSP